MALVVKDRVKETSTTAGTGTLTLAGAATGFQTFSSAIGNGNTTYYAISDSTAGTWEVGLGTVAAGTLARTTVLASSNSGSLVTFSSNSKDVFCTYPAGKADYQDANGDSYSPQFVASNGLFVNAKTVSTNYTIPTNYNAMSSGTVTVASGISVTVTSGSRWVVL
jgi:hypothetical protein